MRLKFKKLSEPATAAPGTVRTSPWRAQTSQESSKSNQIARRLHSTYQPAECEHNARNCSEHAWLTTMCTESVVRTEIALRSGQLLYNVFACLCTLSFHLFHLMLSLSLSPSPLGVFFCCRMRRSSGHNRNRSARRTGISVPLRLECELFNASQTKLLPSPPGSLSNSVCETAPAEETAEREREETN